MRCAEYEPGRSPRSRLDIERFAENRTSASKYFGFLRFHWPEEPGTDFVSITLGLSSVENRESGSK